MAMRRLVPVENFSFSDMEIISKCGLDNYMHHLAKTRRSTSLSNISVLSDQDESEEAIIEKIEALDKLKDTDNVPNKGLKRTSTFNSVSSGGSSGYSSPPSPPEQEKSKSIKRSYTFNVSNAPRPRPRLPFRQLVPENRDPSSPHFGNSMIHNNANSLLNTPRSRPRDSLVPERRNISSLHNTNITMAQNNANSLLNTKKTPVIRKTVADPKKKVGQYTPNPAKLTSPKLGESFEKRNIDLLKRKTDRINAANKSEVKPFKARPMPNYARLDMNKF